MTEQLRCTVVMDFPVVVVEVAGNLDLASAATVRAALITCLTGQPELILVDLAGMTVGAGVSVGVFAAVACRAASWPGCALMLCRPGPEVAAALESTVVCRHLPVHPSLDEALAAHTTNPVLPQFRMRLSAVPSAPAQARRLVDGACQAWGLATVSDIAQLVVTELVTNAVRHAGTEIDLRVARHQRRLQVSVRDRSSLPPRRGSAASLEAEGGRGLLVVEALSTAWGSVPTSDGKVVWASLSVAMS